MILISNSDRDKAVEYLRSYAELLKRNGAQTTRQINTARMANNLATRLERKRTDSVTKRIQNN